MLSVSHELTMPRGTEECIEALFRKFKKEYTNYYQKQVKRLQKRYSDITNPNRRTGKALKNICFFIWYCTKTTKNDPPNVIFKTLVLFFAQDDFCDNPQISYLTKQEFYSICDNLLEKKRYKVPNTYTLQFKEIIKLWREIVKEIGNFSPQLYSYWKKTAQQMNNAMRKEEYKPHGQIVPFDEYMRSAIYSIGAIFIWTTYFIIKKVPIEILKTLEPALLNGATIVRLSNDLASYRENKNKVNAVNIVRDKKNPEKYISELIEKESQKLDEDLRKLNVENWIKQTIQRSTKFLIEFYKNTDFTKDISSTSIG